MKSNSTLKLICVFLSLQLRPPVDCASQISSVWESPPPPEAIKKQPIDGLSSQSSSLLPSIVGLDDDSSGRQQEIRRVDANQQQQQQQQQPKPKFKLAQVANLADDQFDFLWTGADSSSSRHRAKGSAPALERRHDNSSEVQLSSLAPQHEPADERNLSSSSSNAIDFDDALPLAQFGLQLNSSSDSSSSLSDLLYVRPSSANRSTDFQLHETTNWPESGGRRPAWTQTPNPMESDDEQQQQQHRRQYFYFYDAPNSSSSTQRPPIPLHHNQRERAHSWPTRAPALVRHLGEQANRRAIQPAASWIEQQPAASLLHRHHRPNHRLAAASNQRQRNKSLLSSIGLNKLAASWPNLMQQQQQHAASELLENSFYDSTPQLSLGSAAQFYPPIAAPPSGDFQNYKVGGQRARKRPQSSAVEFGADPKASVERPNFIPVVAVQMTRTSPAPSGPMQQHQQTYEMSPTSFGSSAASSNPELDEYLEHKLNRLNAGQSTRNYNSLASSSHHSAAIRNQLDQQPGDQRETTTIKSAIFGYLPQQAGLPLMQAINLLPHLPNFSQQPNERVESAASAYAPLNMFGAEQQSRLQHHQFANEQPAAAELEPDNLVHPFQVAHSSNQRESTQQLDYSTYSTPDGAASVLPQVDTQNQDYQQQQQQYTAQVPLILSPLDYYTQQQPQQHQLVPPPAAKYAQYFAYGQQQQPAASNVYFQHADESSSRPARDRVSTGPRSQLVKKPASNKLLSNKWRKRSGDFFANAGQLLLSALPLLLAPTLGLMFASSGVAPNTAARFQMPPTLKPTSSQVAAPSFNIPTWTHMAANDSNSDAEPHTHAASPAPYVFTPSPASASSKTKWPDETLDKGDAEEEAKESQVEQTKSGAKQPNSQTVSVSSYASLPALTGLDISFAGVNPKNNNPTAPTASNQKSTRPKVNSSRATSTTSTSTSTSTTTTKRPVTIILTTLTPPQNSIHTNNSNGAHFRPLAQPTATLMLVDADESESNSTPAADQVDEQKQKDEIFIIGASNNATGGHYLSLNGQVNFDDQQPTSSNSSHQQHTQPAHSSSYDGADFDAHVASLQQVAPSDGSPQKHQANRATDQLHEPQLYPVSTWPMARRRTTISLVTQNGNRTVPGTVGVASRPNSSLSYRPSEWPTSTMMSSERSAAELPVASHRRAAGSSLYEFSHLSDARANARVKRNSAADIGQLDLLATNQTATSETPPPVSDEEKQNEVRPRSGGGPKKRSRKRKKVTRTKGTTAAAASANGTVAPPAGAETLNSDGSKRKSAIVTAMITRVGDSRDSEHDTQAAQLVEGQHKRVLLLRTEAEEKEKSREKSAEEPSYYLLSGIDDTEDDEQQQRRQQQKRDENSDEIQLARLEQSPVRRASGRPKSALDLMPLATERYPARPTAPPHIEVQRHGQHWQLAPPADQDERERELEATRQRQLYWRNSNRADGQQQGGESAPADVHSPIHKYNRFLTSHFVVANETRNHPPQHFGYNSTATAAAIPNYNSSSQTPTTSGNSNSYHYHQQSPAQYERRDQYYYPDYRRAQDDYYSGPNYGNKSAAYQPTGPPLPLPPPSYSAPPLGIYGDPAGRRSHSESSPPFDGYNYSRQSASSSALPPPPPPDYYSRNSAPPEYHIRHHPEPAADPLLRFDAPAMSSMSQAPPLGPLAMLGSRGPIGGAQDKSVDSRAIGEYLKRVQFSDSDRDKLMASYLTCDGLLNESDHCLERLSCEFSDPQNIDKANKLDRAVSSILLGHILINTYIPDSFKLRLKSASLFGYTQSGKCSKYNCSKLTPSSSSSSGSGAADAHQSQSFND